MTRKTAQSATNSTGITSFISFPRGALGETPQSCLLFDCDSRGSEQAERQSHFLAVEMTNKTQNGSFWLTCSSQNLPSYLLSTHWFTGSSPTKQQTVAANDELLENNEFALSVSVKLAWHEKWFLAAVNASQKRDPPLFAGVILFGGGAWQTTLQTTFFAARRYYIGRKVGIVGVFWLLHPKRTLIVSPIYFNDPAGKKNRWYHQPRIY